MKQRNNDVKKRRACGSFAGDENESGIQETEDGIRIEENCWNGNYWGDDAGAGGDGKDAR